MRVVTRLALLSSVLLCSCQPNSPIGRFFRSVNTTRDFLAWACPVAFGVLFVGGGIVLLIKNLRAPTDRVRTWNRRFGFVNLVFGALVVANALFTPPREVETQTVPTGVLEEVSTIGPNGLPVIEERPQITTREVAGETDVPSMLVMLVVGLGLMGLGAAEVRVGTGKDPVPTE